MFELTGREQMHAQKAQGWSTLRGKATQAQSGELAEQYILKETGQWETETAMLSPAASMDTQIPTWAAPGVAEHTQGL